jgi:hypothetical protein
MIFRIRGPVLCFSDTFLVWTGRTGGKRSYSATRPDHGCTRSAWAFNMTNRVSSTPVQTFRPSDQPDGPGLFTARLQGLRGLRPEPGIGVVQACHTAGGTT